MEADLFDEADLYRSLAGCGARVLLIGRRAVIAWGIPVITAQRREEIEVSPNVRLPIPTIDDLILTKRFAARPKDAEDIRLLRALKGENLLVSLAGKTP